MRKYPFKTFTAIVTFALIATGCAKIELTYGNRSGTVDDDYIEEPVSATSKIYENALLTSNAIIELLISNNLQTLHDDFVGKEVYSMFTIDKLTEIRTHLYKTFGPVLRYKEQQWGFVPKEIKEGKCVYSVKIVEHEKVSLDYFFVFRDGGKYDKIIGFYTKPRNGARIANHL